MFKRIRHKLFCSYKTGTKQIPSINIATKPEIKPVFEYSPLLEINEITLYK